MVKGQHEKHHKLNKRIEEVAWATQFRMLHTVRLSTEQPDLWIVGLDHFPTNSTYLLEHLTDAFGIMPYQGDFLHAPLLFADGDKKFSKSLGNARFITPDTLIKVLRENENQGVDLKDAPVSSDIMVVGADFLPDYMLKNRREREGTLLQENSAYEQSDRPKRFASANAKGAIENEYVAGILGVPHL